MQFSFSAYHLFDEMPSGFVNLYSLWVSFERCQSGNAGGERCKEGKAVLEDRKGTCVCVSLIFVAFPFLVFSSLSSVIAAALLLIPPLIFLVLKC